MSSGTLYLGENAVSPSVASALMKYSAGENIEISDDLIISATDTKYTAGNNITIDDENKINAKEYKSGKDIEIAEDGTINSTAFSLPNPTGKEASILMTDGVDAYWEKPATFNLLDRKESDHILDDIRWLRADTFSWHSGDMYPAVYEHLVNDVASIPQASLNIGKYLAGVGATGTAASTSTTLAAPTSSSATEGEISSIVVDYFVAHDGHKIAFVDQEPNIMKLYEATGGADFYILDASNKRFKLPRKQNRKLVLTSKSAHQWFNLYSDGWVEQGGLVNNTTAVKTITLTIPMRNNTYSVQCTSYYNTSDATLYQPHVYNLTTTTFQSASYGERGSGTNTNGQAVIWRVDGFASLGARGEPDFAFEYYYVGEFNKTSIEQLASVTSETLNAKVDADFNNVSSAGTALMAHSSMPSATNYTDFTLGASGEQYTMPADGWLFFSKATSATNQWISIDSVTVSGFGMTNQMPSSGANATTYLPVSKDDIVVIAYTAAGATNMFRLFHCNGAS